LKKAFALRQFHVEQNTEKSSQKKSEVIWEFTLKNLALIASNEPKKLDNLRKNWVGLMPKNFATNL